MSKYLSDAEYARWKHAFLATPKQMDAYAEYLSGGPETWEHETVTFSMPNPEEKFPEEDESDTPSRS